MLANHTLRQKIFFTSVMAAVVILALTLSAFVTTQALSAKNDLIESKSALVEVVAANSTAALIFVDNEAALEILAHFGSDPEVVSATLYDENEKTVAHFKSTRQEHLQLLTNIHKKEIEENREEQIEGNGITAIYHTNDYLDLDKNIVLDQQIIGYLDVQFDITRLHDNVVKLSIIAIIILITATIAAFLFANKLQKYITGPLLAVKNTMERVSSEQNYSVRIPNTYTDELGVLTNGFNSMLTQIQQRDKALERSKEEAESANKSKSAFLANMSHEIRTPMNGVLGMAELLLASDLNEKQSRYANTIQSSGESLLTIINDVLDFSKIEAGHFILESIEFDLCQLVEDTANMLASSAHRKCLELTVSIPPETPNNLKGDPGRIRQVITNLLGNAIKFTEQGEINIRVIKQYQEKEIIEYRIEVQDDGIGIPKHKQLKIFEAFSQADDSTTREFGGTGLGLAISNQIVNLMDGTLDVESTPGKGSLFWFTVPLLITDNITPSRSKTKLISGTRVLVLDDNTTNREVLRTQIKNLGATVSEASTGLQAIEMLQGAQSFGNPYELLVLDYLMPEMDGLTVIDLLQKKSSIKHIPVIILSSSNQPVKANTEQLKSIKCFLEKPVRQAQLRDCISEVFFQQSKEGGDMQKMTSHMGNSKILLAEDNPVNQEVAINMIEDLGGNIILAENGAEALELLKTNDVDLILMDCQMPVIDGFEATRLFRASEQLGSDGKRMPIIALTANVLSDTEQDCIDSGMDDYLSKPYTQVALKEKIEYWLTKKNGPPVNQAFKGQEVRVEQQHRYHIDASALDKISALQQPGRPNLVAKIITLYLETTPPLIAQIHQGLKENDCNTIHMAAHSLKSSAANIGALALADLLKNLIINCKDGNMDQVEKIVSAVDPEQEYVVNELKDLSQKQNSDGE